MHLAKKRVLIFIVSYNAEKTIASVLDRIPKEVLHSENYETEVLVIDDCSSDETFSAGSQHASSFENIPINFLVNPRNLGYGGNQKLGYFYAIKEGFDIVALIHGDGQYAPEKLPELLAPLLAEEAEAVFGSRFMPPKGALQGGMPLYKYLGNRVLSWCENRSLGTKLSEWHSGYRLYSCKALQKIPFSYNSEDFDFDTEIIIQLKSAGCCIKELPIPTFYGNEICHVNGLKYAAKILLDCLQYRLQRYGLFYSRKFDLESDNLHYTPKYDFFSSHSLGLASVKKDETVLLLGCGPADLVEPFVKKGASVIAVDQFVSDELEELCHGAVRTDVDDLEYVDDIPEAAYSKIVALDIIEHLHSPELFLERIRRSLLLKESTLVLSTPNIGFFAIRLMLLLGYFNYGKKGILDRTHTRLFTFSSLRNALTQCGFEVLSMRGVPAPFPLALGRDSTLARIVLNLNLPAIKLSKGMFSYQIFCTARPMPTVEMLLERTKEHTNAIT